MCLFEELLLMRDSTPQEMEYMDARIQRIASCFQLNFCREINLDEIAGRYGFSRRNFYRCWKRCFPMSPAAVSAGAQAQRGGTPPERNGDSSLPYHCGIEIPELRLFLPVVPEEIRDDSAAVQEERNSGKRNRKIKELSSDSFRVRYPDPGEMPFRFFILR